MNLKQEMQFAGEYYGELPLHEMAQQHFDNQVADLIKDGEYEKAAERYIDNHGSAKPPQKATATTSKLKRGDFAKTLKADSSKVEQINKEEWDKFEQAYSELMGTASQEKRGYKKTKGTVDPATGKVKTSAQTGAARTSGLDKLEGKVRKIATEHQKALETAEGEEKEEIKDRIRGLEILGQALQNTKSGRATLPPQTEAEYEKLAARYEKIGGNLLDKIKGLAAIQGPTGQDDDVKTATDAMKKKIMSDKGLKMISSIEDEIEDFKMRKELKGQSRAEVLPPKMEESMKIAGKILAESYEYRGVDFWTNYIGSSIIRSFNEDVKKYGAKNARDMYCYAFGGKEVAPIFNYMIEDTEMLNEASEVKGVFLFETVGRINVNNYLTEAPAQLTTGLGGGGGRRAARAFEYTPASELAGIAAGEGSRGAAQAAASVAGKAGKQAGLMGWLSGLWEKFKDFGKPLVKKLGGFISQGAKWAKEIAQKGMEFLHTNPVARVAVPAVALAGTVAGGIALVNKIRKKAGKDKLSKEEESKLKNVAEKNEDKLESKYGAKVA